MVSKVTYDIIKVFGNKWLAIIYVDYRKVDSEKFDSRAEAVAWVHSELAARI